MRSTNIQLLHLNDDLLQIIVSCACLLDTFAVCSLSQVCAKFHWMCAQEPLWKLLCAKKQLGFKYAHPAMACQDLYKLFHSIQTHCKTTIQSWTDYTLSISKNACAGQRALRLLKTLPENVMVIHDFAFYNCHHLMLDTLPTRSLSLIKESAFEACRSMTLSNWLGDLERAREASGFEGSLRVIGPRAFMNCHELALSKLPDSITDICEQAFAHCYKLALTALPPKLVSINTMAFAHCKELSLTHIPGDVVSIDCRAFEGCVGLKRISFPHFLIQIGERAFNGCKALECIDFTLSIYLDVIEGGAFEGCTSLTTLVPPSAKLVGGFKIAEDAFKGCPKFTKWTPGGL